MGGSVLSQLGPAPSIVLVRLRSLGDSVLATPAFAILRRAVPHARIHVAMDEQFADLLAGQPDIDSVLPLAGGSGIKAKAGLVRRIRALRPRLCVDMHGGSTAAWLTAFSGAAWRVGFAHFRHSWAYNEKVPRAQEVLGRAPSAKVHTAEHHAATMIHLGAAGAEIPAARLARRPAPSRAPYFALHAGAAYATKRWAVDHFRTIATEIARSCDLRPVFVAGPGEEWLAPQLPGFELCKDLTFPALARLLAGARLFVGNDSGPAHLAAAFGVPCVVVFGSSDSAVWHPWRTPHRVVETQWDCKPCPGDRCYAFETPRCILSVEPGVVSSAAAELVGPKRSPSDVSHSVTPHADGN